MQQSELQCALPLLSNFWETPIANMHKYSNWQRYILFDFQSVSHQSGLAPYEYICKIWTKEPERFTLDPTHQMPGLNT